MKALLRSRKEGNGREGSAQSMETSVAQFRQEIDRFVDRFWRGAWENPLALVGETMPWPQWKTPWWPWLAVDVTEDEKTLTIRADVPGLESKDITVEISGNELTIRGSRDEEKTQKKANVTRNERPFGRFERTVTLPSHVDAEKVEAKYEKGTLTVTIPRIPGGGPKRVDVKAV